MNGAGEPAPKSDSGGTADVGKLAENVYKNIQVLKGISADQVVPSMGFCRIVVRRAVHLLPRGRTFREGRQETEANRARDDADGLHAEHRQF